MHETQGSLMEFPTGMPPNTLSKKAFAEFVGITPGRVSQMITSGLPVEPNGRIHVERGRTWMRTNIDPTRRRANIDSTPDFDCAASQHGMTLRAKRDLAEAEISRLKAERLAGRLIDRRSTLRVVEGRAKSEREALIGWVNRASPAIAAATGGDLATITAVLDREAREHLVH